MGSGRKHFNDLEQQFEYLGAGPSILGKEWVAMYKTRDEVDFGKVHFEAAMMNVIREPNINSTAILRTDILIESHESLESTNNENDISPPDRDPQHNAVQPPHDPDALKINIDDLTVRYPAIDNQLKLQTISEFVRQLVPRNPYKDAMINQTCLLLNSLTNTDTSLVVYTPHINEEDECPFYIPYVQAVGILLHKGSLSVHYIPFSGTVTSLLANDKERVVRTALRLLQTAHKHSRGIMQGYKKRVNHDQVVGKVQFQNTYIALKKKYSQFLTENWVESTDPMKHVFEDIAIAAFLLELWKLHYGPEFRNQIQFRDLGCGNGVLCYILIEEGCKGFGIDARKRKSWKIYPDYVKKILKEQVIIPSVLLRPPKEVRQQLPSIAHNGQVYPVKLSHDNKLSPITILYSSEDLLNSPQVNTAEFPNNTFIIGNHSDELTCWIPLLGYPFMVIPCCSYNLAGQRVRYNVHDKSYSSGSPNGRIQNSTYAGLVSHVEYLTEKVGWELQKEMLRIPSTRNAAVIGLKNKKLDQFFTHNYYELLLEEGGTEGWVQSTMALMNNNPRNH